ncbi:SRPBCC family protein [Pleionea sp. CnH1-48]|uniref:SRPBCC family protein n=1 Tax=Pleionea sp. CnH1-48 TaxID=2954494 RepID=UPI002096EE69|nr:SRPBCC family protein [Pleionea sp. CnH1-48]MCO7223390.1 SRPBCC family protein [Pleionea sp. CnH1-48]
MNRYGTLIDDNTLEFRRLLPGPIERVWSFIVDPEKRARWLAGGETDPKVGGTMELNFKNSELSPKQDEAPGESCKDMPDCVPTKGVITQFNPPHLFGFTWLGEKADTEVRISLEQQGEKVLLTLIHSRLVIQDERLGIMAGWHTHLNIFEDVLGDQIPEGFWKQHNALEKEYEAML